MVPRPQGGGTPGTVWVHMHVCVHTHVCFVCAHTCAQVCALTSACVHVFPRVPHIGLYAHVCTCVCAHECVRIHVSQFTRP